MRIAFDPAKNARNIKERGLSFERVDEVDPESVRIIPDLRRDYGEPRLRAFGMLEGRLHMFVFTWRDDVMRIISFRRASDKEEEWYEEEIG